MEGCNHYTFDTGEQESDNKFVPAQEMENHGTEHCPAKELDDSQLSKIGDEIPEDKDIRMCTPERDCDKVVPEITLVLAGDSSSIEIGPQNILLDHDGQTHQEQFSSKLYDMFGRHIRVINMLGQSDVDSIPLNQAAHAFILLIASGRHSSRYSSGIQWIEKTFRKESLPFVMTVVTHTSEESCENALVDLLEYPSFVAERYHSCSRSMTNLNEVVELLEKVDIMIFENNWQRSNEQIAEPNDNQKLPDHTANIIESNTKAEEIKIGIKLKNDQLEQSDDDLFKKNDEESRKQPEIKFEPEDTVEKMESRTETNSKEQFGAELSKANDKSDGESEIEYHLHEKEEKDNLELDIKGIGRKMLNITDEKGKKCQPEIEKLLSRLHLQDRANISAPELLAISPPLKQSNETSEKDLALTFLQKLMMLDYRARYIPVCQDSSDMSYLEPLWESDNPYSDDSDLDDLYNTAPDSDQFKQIRVHPMDVQMAVFHSSDNFMKQNMITKLSQCLYALPLLVPDPFLNNIECPLWTFRKINKTWKITHVGGDHKSVKTIKSMPICKAETPLVTFFRLGSLSVSKSQLMNTLINDRHSTFFHRNCPGSTKSHYMMDGVAEIAWYCPAGKPNDSFTDCIAFCNLHGDALVKEKQFEILTAKSSIIVLLVPALDKNLGFTTVISTLYRSPKPLIILNADSDSGAIQVKIGKYKLGLKDRSQSDVSEELKGIIRNILPETHTTFQLESLAEVSGIRVDENDPVCVKGKSAAMKMVKLIEGMDISKIKEEFLPCQGQLWHDWCKINKELYHLKGHIEKEKEKKTRELRKIREKQCDASCSELMRFFTTSLQELLPKDKEYFLKWTQILIDGLSTDDLASILQNYDETWSEVLVLKKKHEKSALLKRKEDELEEISKKLQSATFGLEHIFREMGQIYEAHMSQRKQTTCCQTDWMKYPELAAELMISGYPMELMDGDAGHVPLTWISSLLQEVIKKLGDQRVFVLSVLGVQSSGKSTMLNAMFGLQFAVSAGRCTKGAYMQLARLSDEIKKDYNFDYVLVVDTEGLRALELAGNTTLHHDNQLATFVVGLGNMTLINIFGENPADMQDVLQIVVQAIMRMKKVKLSPSCVFVHQNVTDVAAVEKNMDGKRRLQERLDKMAQLAAEEEVCDVECFNDVIGFDVQTDVKYFAQLWEGSPPMAPPNPGYSESVQELKNIILSKASKSKGILLSHFISKIKDLWKALMNEHFVFSFKNTQEIAAYRKLEVQYGNWTWTLRSEMLKIENQLHPKIEIGQLDKIEKSYFLKEMGKTYEELKKEMAAYFEDDRDKEILVQWRGQFENKIKEFHDEHIREVNRKLNEVIQQKNARKKLDNKKTEFEKTLLQQSKDLAHILKDVVKNEEDLKAQFDSVWNQWVSDLTSDTTPIKDINLDEDLSTVFGVLGVEWSVITESKNTGRYKKFSEIGNYSDYVTQKKHQKQAKRTQSKETQKEIKPKDTSGVWTKVLSGLTFVKQMVGHTSTTQGQISHESQNGFAYEEQVLIRSFIDNVEQETLKSIKTKPVSTMGYTSTYLQEVAKYVQDKLLKFESEQRYSFKKQFTVDLLLYIFDNVVSWLSESHNTYRNNNDVLTHLNNKKKEYYNIFKSYCKGNSSAVVFGEIMCKNLHASAVEAIIDQTAVALAGEMRSNYPAFNGNRLNLEKHLLTSLAEKADFHQFKTYIHNPRKQISCFITKEVKSYIFTKHKSKAEKILKNNVDNIDKIIKQALFESTDKVKKLGGNINTWMKEFSSSLNNKLTLDTSFCQNFPDIKDFDFLREEIEKGLEIINKELGCLPLDKVKTCRKPPDQILIDQLCNCCWERCPFCAAVCTNTLKDHSPDKHSVPFHRPSGVKGWHTRGKVDLVIDFCTTLVGSDRQFYPSHDSEISVPYKQYPTAGEKYASWRITADESKLTYWKWFVCHFQKELEDHYDLKFVGYGEIPKEWRSYTRENAIQSLDEMIRL